MKYGLALDPIGEGGVSLNKEFIYVNGILHSNQPVTKVIYKRDVKPVNLPADYKLLLAHKIAYHITMAPGKDLERRSYIYREMNNYHLRATRGDSMPSGDPQTRELIEYFRANRREAYTR